MASRRAPLAARHAYVLAGALLIGTFAAAFVSQNETRSDFIIRNRVGEFEFDAPRLDAPDIDGPNVDGPNIDGPNIDGPNIDAPAFNFGDALLVLFYILIAVALVVGLLMVLRRFGPGAPDDVESRTHRLAASDRGRTAYEPGDAGWAAFERFCYELLHDPDPARAIRVAMRYADAGMGHLEPRQVDETPNEWLRRIDRGRHDLAVDLGLMVQSYNSVRFGGNTASPAERDDAVNALRRLAHTACGAIAPEVPDAGPVAPA